MAGMPAVSVPVALTAKEGLPLGLQLIAGPLAEARLLAAAHVLEHQAQRHSCAEGGQLAPLKKPGEGKAPLNTV
jgi:Asp-tRNA(Asn)/Glu-tRNA(Gln) amidotransferase A subunit family amidase